MFDKTFNYKLCFFSLIYRCWRSYSNSIYLNVWDSWFAIILLILFFFKQHNDLFLCITFKYRLIIMIRLPANPICIGENYTKSNTYRIVYILGAGVDLYSHTDTDTKQRLCKVLFSKSIPHVLILSRFGAWSGSDLPWNQFPDSHKFCSWELILDTMLPFINDFHESFRQIIN